MTEPSIRPRPPCRVAYLTTRYPSVSHSFIQREILALEQAGVEILPMAINPTPDAEVLTETDRRERQRTFAVKAQPATRLAAGAVRALRRRPLGFLAALGVAVRSAGFDAKAALWRAFQLGEATAVWDHCERSGVRHVHAHFGQAPATVAWLTTELGNRLDPDGPRWSWTVTIHGWHEFVNERDAALREKVASARAVVCISDYTRAQLMRIAHPDDWPKLHVVRCGIDTAEFELRPPRLIATPPRVLVVGRLSPEKGHLVLLEAAGILRDRGIRIEMDLVGPGDFAAQLTAAADRLGVGPQTHFLGARSPAEVGKLLRDADVFCLPTFAEGLPVALMEAMAVGVPVVTTYISGIPELVVDGETGLVVPAGRPDLLADAIERLCSEPTLVDALTGAARARVEAQHELERNVVALRPILCAD
jgi:colanic acid/amylovoran biosynthesis glycosyltransferase